VFWGLHSDWTVGFVASKMKLVLYYMKQFDSKSQNYGGESVNWSQMDIKRKIYDIRKWKMHLFLHQH
jgi:hypothetical protein